MNTEHESTWHPFRDGVWPRRAVIGLWLAIFLVGGSALVSKWDSLMNRLARPPLAGGPVAGAPR